MSLELVVDNDVLIKCACYALLEDLLQSGAGGDIGVLGAARYVVAGRLQRAGGATDPERAKASFSLFLANAVELEPTAGELQLASEIEEQAAIAGLDLDAGESQICAIAVHRVLPLVVTGDKRAIASAEQILPSVVALECLQGRVVCLEQVILGFVKRMGAAVVRSRVCAEPDVDRALSICFECNSESARAEFSPEVGLRSYMNAVRTAAPTLLFAGDALFGS